MQFHVKADRWGESGRRQTDQGSWGSEKLVRASGDVVPSGDTGVGRSQEPGPNSPLLTSQGAVALSLGHALLFLVSEGGCLRVGDPSVGLVGTFLVWPGPCGSGPHETRSWRDPGTQEFL